MQTDPMGDMLTTIRNGYLAGRKVVAVPHSRMKEGVLRVMKEGGYIEEVETVAEQNRRVLVVTLRYRDSRPAIDGLRRVSKPGRRLYAEKKKIPFVRSGFGMAIISTSKGIMSDRNARREGVGGEIICEVW